MRDTKRAVMLAATGMVMAAGAAMAFARPPLAVIRAIPPGLWELREVGVSDPSTRLCVRDPGMLFQVRHAAAHCERMVLEDRPNQATVDYSCRGAGQGRTTIRLDGGGAARISTQGVVDGAPFDTRYDLHRIGACAR